MTIKRGSDQAVQVNVAIAPRHRRKAGMELVVHGLRPGNCYVVRKIGVRTQQPASLAALTTGVEVDDLPRGMHASVGATGTGDFDRFVGDAAKRFFHVRLHTVTGALPLPTVVRGSVVLNAQGNSQNSRRLRRK